MDLNINDLMSGDDTSVGEELAKLLGLSEEPTVLTAGRQSRRDNEMRQAMIKLGFRLDRVFQEQLKTNGAVRSLRTEHDAIQKGESAHGCAHLDAVKSDVRWIIRIGATVFIALMGIALWSLKVVMGG